MQPRPNACMSCEHWSGTWPEGDRWPACAAFPDGIPIDVWSGRVSHADALEGDHGIQWQIADEDMAATYLAYWMETDEEVDDEPANQVDGNTEADQ